MGHWNEAQGSIAIPQKELPKVRKAFSDAVNLYRSRVFNAASDVIIQLKNDAVRRSDLILPLHKQHFPGRKFLDHACHARIGEKLLRLMEREHVFRELAQGRDGFWTPSDAWPHDYFLSDVISLIEETIPKNAKRFDPRKAKKLTMPMLDRIVGKPYRKNPSLVHSDAIVMLDGDTVLVEVGQGRGAIEDFEESFFGRCALRTLRSVNYGKRKDKGGVVYSQNELAAENFCSPSVLWTFGNRA